MKEIHKEKQNCWEHKRCGREPGGVKVRELGVCTAAVEQRYDGINDGDNGGRFCWKIAGTLCANQVQGSWADKMNYCVKCGFFMMVKKEQGRSMKY